MGIFDVCMCTCGHAASGHFSRGGMCMTADCGCGKFVAAPWPEDMLRSGVAKFPVREVEEISPATTALMNAAMALVALHVVIDRDRDGARRDSYCVRCHRAGLGGGDIEHAPSCTVGQVLAAVQALSVPQAEPVSPAPQLVTGMPERTVEYFAQGGVLPEGVAFIVGEQASESPFHGIGTIDSPLTVHQQISFGGQVMDPATLVKVCERVSKAFRERQERSPWSTK